MFAGKTATSSAVRPQAAARRIPAIGMSKPIAPSSSHPPLIAMQAKGNGIQGGMAGKKSAGWLR